jgi:hypothetical protein
MNTNSINKAKSTRWLANVCILCAALVGSSGLVGQTPSPAPQWPSMQDRPKVKMGFTRALNRSAREKKYRDALLDFTKPEVVRAKVQEELRKVPGCENMTIPTEIILMFYEPQPSTVHVTASPMPTEVKDFMEKWENRNVHVFYLPDFNVGDTTDHPYDLHLRCCYRPW